MLSILLPRSPARGSGQRTRIAPRSRTTAIQLSWVACLVFVLSTGVSAAPPELGWEISPGMGAGGLPDFQTGPLGRLRIPQRPHHDERRCGCLDER
jgi:hypothetical protein